MSMKALHEGSHATEDEGTEDEGMEEVLDQLRVPGGATGAPTASSGVPGGATGAPTASSGGGASKVDPESSKWNWDPAQMNRGLFVTGNSKVNEQILGRIDQTTSEAVPGGMSPNTRERKASRAAFVDFLVNLPDPVAVDQEPASCLLTKKKDPVDFSDILQKQSVQKTSSGGDIDKKETMAAGGKPQVEVQQEHAAGKLQPQGIHAVWKPNVDLVGRISMMRKSAAEAQETLHVSPLSALDLGKVGSPRATFSTDLKSESGAAPVPLDSRGRR
ncbi:unnamed protein product, partial [Amoebophrya sp. A25]|eukprot:GSA25T00010575001.1